MKNTKIIMFSLLQICLLIPSSLKSQQLNQQEKESQCLQSKVQFDNSSLEKIVMHPEDVLANPDSFWESDSAYGLVKLWHKRVSFPIQMEDWKKQVQFFKNLSPEDREKNPQLVAARNMVKREKEFNDKAVNYLCSFLPKECSDISTTIYFTTAIMASGFQLGNDIVIYGANADKDNLFIHELFHLGFNKCKPSNSGYGLEDSTINQIYNDLQNEGMATYVGYKALDEFPNFDPDPFRNDYGFLENSATRNRLHQRLNVTLKKFPSLIGTVEGRKELQDTLWQVGSMERAYYVIGCFMAQTIDKMLGRDELVGTILKGPKSFLQTYNSLVDEKLQVLDLYKKN